MIATERHLSEQIHHDRQARERADDFQKRRADLRFADSDYLDHENWIRPAFARLGDLNGKRVLDLGCGHGMAAVVLARRGAIVTGVDLSAGYVAEARARARSNEVDARFLQADAEQLPFASAAFDAVWGSAILHHLDLERAGRELHRVLRPGGVAVFCEPWGGNPILNFARRWLPYPGKDRTPDERPLKSRDLLPRQSRSGGWLDRCDDKLLRLVPALKSWCRYVVVTMRG
jgi:SAM-dependent methyltransferase